MSCLRLSLKLPPARKAWKILTSKLQKKLPNFRRRRPDKLIACNTTSRYHQTRALGPSKVTVLVRPRVKNRAKSSNKHKLLESRPHQPRLFAFKRRSTTPVFVDNLFKEPMATSFSATQVVVDRKKTEQASGADPNDEGTSLGGEGSGDDDSIWESTVMSSPMMHDIDERAEAFIAKFWADMKHQEAMARRQS